MRKRLEGKQLLKKAFHSPLPNKTMNNRVIFIYLFFQVKRKKSFASRPFQVDLIDFFFLLFFQSNIIFSNNYIQKEKHEGSAAEHLVPSTAGFMCIFLVFLVFTIVYFQLQSKTPLKKKKMFLGRKITTVCCCCRPCGFLRQKRNRDL